MSGRILIVDELATNRILLKVKLSAAYYDVLQAKNGEDALKIVADHQPDLILSSTNLSDIDDTTFIQAVRTQENSATVPVVLILPRDCPEARIAALNAGASDVLTKPLEETLMLARLRSLLRQKHMEHDLKLHAGTAHALGFSETQNVFTPPGRVAVVATHKSEALQLRHNLAAFDNHEYLAISEDDALVPWARTKCPDIFVLKFDGDACDDGLRMMAELRAAPNTRNCPIIVMLPNNIRKIAATVLDMGANDATSSAADPQELTLRIAKQLKHKQHADMMRDQLHVGLQAAVIDQLTGLYNRRYAIPFLERLINSANREGRTFSVMVADLDHFKRINDRYGHAVGDAVLTHVSEVLRSNLRDEDLIARIGGEEFLIVVPDTSHEQARQTADRLCRIIQRTPINIPGQEDPIKVTISIGAAMSQPIANGALPTVERLLDQADRALYGSKAGGRNTVTLDKRPAA